MDVDKKMTPILDMLYRVSIASFVLIWAMIFGLLAYYRYARSSRPDTSTSRTSSLDLGVKTIHVPAREERLLKRWLPFVIALLVVAIVVSGHFSHVQAPQRAPEIPLPSHNIQGNRIVKLAAGLIACGGILIGFAAICAEIACRCTLSRRVQRSPYRRLEDVTDTSTVARRYILPNENIFG
jgi:hypothetical protein